MTGSFPLSSASADPMLICRSANGGRASPDCEHATSDAANRKRNNWERILSVDVDDLRMNLNILTPWPIKLRMI
jgi:hypothetical protein